MDLIRNSFVYFYKWVVKHWKSMQRDIDMEILWPTFLRASINRNHALRAFAVHVRLDPAWHVDLDEMTVDQRRFVVEMIDNEFGAAA